MTDHSNNSRRSPIPDVPQMRSVLIRAPSSFGVDGRIATLSHAASPLSSSPGLSLKHTPLPESKVLLTPGSTSSTLAAPKQTSWTVVREDIRRLPEQYPLERSHAHIDNVGEVQEVADRISDCLRLQSIAAVVDEDKAMVLAETQEHVRFCIRLFLDSNDRIIVEVQRRTGCCFLFHQACKAVLRSAQGIKPQPMLIYEIPDCVKQLEQQHDSNMDCIMEENLEIASSLLQKDRYDAHLLGMESLVQLTHITKSNCSLAAARAILMHSHVLDTILSLIQSWHMHQGSKEDVHELDQDYLAMMHRNALTVLANCLSALEAADDRATLVAQSERILTDPLLTVLIQELASAEQRPHDACLAAKSLNMLVKSSEATKRRIEELGAKEALRVAMKEGVCSHCMLEEESIQLQQEIGIN